MKKIASFTVDHRKIGEGIYLSRVDGDVVTYDLRMRKPNSGDLLTNRAMHSLEHLIATLARNSEMGDRIIYVGPMGCQTGFYFLIRNLDHAENLALIKRIFHDAAAYQGEMPGNSEIECGNYKNLDLDAARNEAKRYERVIQNKTVEDLRYPE